MTKIEESATIVEDGTAHNLRNGERVKVVSTGGRPFLEHTVGLFGTVQHCQYRSQHVISVRFEEGGEFSYPLSALRKAPKA